MPQLLTLPLTAAAAAAVPGALPTTAAAAAQADTLLLTRLTSMLQQQPYPPLRTQPAALESTLMSYVHKGPKGRLYVNGKPWLLKGFDVPHALQLAAGGPKPRSQMLYLLDRAQALGLNGLRVRAFADGTPCIGSATDAPWQHLGLGGQPVPEAPEPGSAASPHLALQPAPGILNATMLSEGLDWLLHEAGLRGMRVILVLTNGGSTAGGGMKQYVDWVDPGLTVNDFYTNDTIKSCFLDYLAGLLDHKSSLSGLPLREDPVVMGWQLAEDASHPGHPSSQSLLAWLKQAGVFIRERAPHQLLLPGVLDIFGRNSPHLLSLNPPAQVFAPASHAPHTYAPVCHGVDFWLHNQLAEMDVATADVHPDAALACNATCKLAWTREWVRGHLRDALRINKPLILGGVGALRPHRWRLQVLQLVREEVERALHKNHPIGGVLLSGLSHPDMPDDSGWGIFYKAKGVHAPRPPLPSLNDQAVEDVKWRRFMNHEAFLDCMAQQARGSGHDKAEASNSADWVDGWEEVVRAVAALGRLPAELQDGPSPPA